MKYIFLILTFFIFSTITLAQSTSLIKAEKEIQDKALGGEFDKQIIDLNNDDKSDIIYTYQCGEPRCVEVYMNIDGVYKQQIEEQGGYKLWQVGNEKRLSLSLYHCCGESPYTSERVFGFNQKTVTLLENYVLTNGMYTESSYLLLPEMYFQQPVFVKNTIDNYNMRFSPTIEKLSPEGKEIFTYGCEEGTNIIAKIKLGSKIKVLANLIEREPAWLFVEVEKNAIAGECNPIDFDFKDQKLRGWISDKFVEWK